MSQIVNKTTLGTDTGTGQTFDAYEMAGLKARFRELSPTAQPGFIIMSRTEPKPTSDFAGVMRGEVTFRRDVADANGILRPNVVRVTSSLPAFQTDAQRVAVVLEALLIMRASVSQDVLSKLLVPQS